MDLKLYPRLGDIWKEVHPRFSRHVMVIGDHGGPLGTVQIQGCYRVPETIGWQTHGPRRWAKLGRFNGKRGGYKLEIRTLSARGEHGSTDT